MSLPFPTVPLTVDIIMINSNGDIVLIERRDPPYGFALPGGFVEPGEGTGTAAEREAKEETGIDVKLIEQFYTYSKPGRDKRGPVATVVYIAAIPEGVEPVAGDDAAEVHVISLEEALLLNLAFDHLDILQDFANYITCGIRPPLNR